MDLKGKLSFFFTLISERTVLSFGGKKLLNESYWPFRAFLVQK